MEDFIYGAIGFLILIMIISLILEAIGLSIMMVVFYIGMAIGSAVGGFNYINAFRENVSLEKLPTP